ncbi:MAG: Nramp family divalent metal transporter [Acidobacteriota bacterium]|nr:Nramp family divalent metal transporter [Acidobacteriota bacterium]
MSMPPVPPAPPGLEPLEKVQGALATSRPRTVRAALRLDIHGRSVRLRGLRLPPTGIWRWLVILGPGLIASAAGNDAGGIATYSATGAQYGYELIWVMLLITVSLSIVQEMCARLGAATGRGLLDLIRERFGVGWAIFAVAVILIANGGLIVSEFVGIGAAVELLGFNKLLMIPAAAALIFYLVVFGNYGRVEKIFLLMTLVFFAYPIAAILGHPHWGEVARGAFVPRLHKDPDYIFLLVGLIGTTITPYMQIFQQSSIVERGSDRRRYGPERTDAYAGAIFSNLMSIFMIIATAATLHVIGKTNIETAADAAKALEPVAGHFAGVLFAVGLLGASLLAAAVLPLATSYAISEAFGFSKGVGLDFRRARLFFTLFTGLMIFGAAVALVPGLPVIKLLLWIQVLNGILLPIILVFIMLLINDSRLMKDLKNTRFYNTLGWGTFVMITLAVVTMLLMQFLGFFGIRLFGS